MPARTRIIFFSICIVYFLTGAAGQDLNFEQFTSRDGLPATECYKIIQDKQGYVWAFTEFGIVKHNGMQFIPVCTNIPFKDQNAYAVFQTQEGEIYFANSFCKIFKIRNDSAFSIKAIENFTRNFTGFDGSIFQIVVDKNKDIYFTGFKTAYHYEVATGNIKKTSGFPEKTNKRFYKRINGFFLSAQVAIDTMHNQSFVIEDGNKIITGSICSENVYETRTLLKVNDSYILGAIHFIYKISRGKSIPSKRLNDVVNFKVDKNNNIWVCTKTGIQVFDSNLNPKGSYLTGKIISDICFDNRGGIWATTIGNGIYYCKNNEEISYSNTRLKHNEILFLNKKDSSMYFSSIDESCWRMNNNNKMDSLYNFKGPFYCKDINRYKNGYLYSTKRGVFFVDAAGKVQEFKEKNTSTYSSYIHIINDNEFLSFGGLRVHYFKNNKAAEVYYLKYQLYCVIPIDHEKYLLGTKNGIFIYDYTTNTCIPYNVFFADKAITSFTYDLYGNLWIGTRGDGIHIITKDGKLISYNHLPFFVVKDIDFYNNLMIVSTNIGVYINTLKNGNIAGDWINIFNSEVNAAKVFNKTLWIASRQGLYSMDFARLTKTDLYPVIISAVYSNSERVLDHSLILNYDQNDLRFNLDFLNYQSKVTNFYFRLDGPTQSSGTISGNVLQIQNLAPGSYKLDVFPYHGPVYNSKHFVSKSFIIEPAYWQTIWFKLLIIFSMISISVLAVALFYNRKRSRDKKQTQVNKLLAEYRLTALKAQINPHFISNSLAAIQLLIDSGKVDKANLYIAKFSLMIRYVLKYSDKSVSRLSDELEIIELNVELEQLRFVNKFNFTMQIADNIDVDELFVPPLIIQPFIENAIWHGLLPMKKGRKPELILKVEKTEDCLTISIIDNGIGRQKTARTNSLNNSSSKESMGTILIRKRMDNLNQLYNTKNADVHILDLYDDQLKAIGTRIDIVLPVSLLNKLAEKNDESDTN